MIISVLKLVVSSILPILFSVFFYIAKEKSAFKKLSYFKQQLIIGVVFGLLAVTATHLGMETDGASINVRDASPLSAGLIFGGPAGIIAGIIGGAERFFASFWDIGTSTQLACSIAALCAGFYAAVIKKVIFENKLPSVFYGILVGVTTEVFHMLLLYFTNLSQLYTAFSFIEKCTLPMLLCNSISLALAILFVSIIKNKGIKIRNKSRKIEYIFRKKISLCILISFSLVIVFSYTTQNNIALTDTEYLLKININDAVNAIDARASDGNIGSLALDWHIGDSGCIILSDKGGNIISDIDGSTGETLLENGIDLDNSSIEPDKIFEAEIHSVKSLCIYRETDDYLVFASIPTKEAFLSREIALFATAFIDSVIFTVLFILIYILIKKVVVRNIEKVNGSLEKITNGQLDETVDVCSNEEFAVLSNDINLTVAALKRYIKEADERIDKELEFAKQIQHSALPSVFPPYPNRKEFDIYAQMDTAKEVGGDFYDFYLLGEDKLAFLVADVSGKGIPAAMFMMTAKTLIKGLAESGMEPDEAFFKANNKLCENNDAGMFVTAWLGILDLKTGLLSYVNAGHNPPMIKRSGKAYEPLRTKPSLFLAGMENIKYKANELQLSPKDEIYIYTDGVTEAVDISDKLFSENRLLTSLNENGNLTVTELCHKVKNDIDSFAGKAQQADDITMLAVRLNYIKNDDTIEVFPDKDSMKTVYDFAEKKNTEFAVDKAVSNKINIALDEIYSNIVSYSGATYAKISLCRTDSNLVLTFTDNGAPYNPLNEEAPDITIPAKDRKIGGMGIFIVKQLASRMEYSDKDGKNRLTLVFEQ